VYPLSTDPPAVVSTTYDQTEYTTNAYLQTLTMLHTRLTRYGEKWLRWVRKNRGTGNKSYIPKRHQDKKWIQQTDDGIYAIHPALYDEIRRARRYITDRFAQHI